MKFGGLIINICQVRNMMTREIIITIDSITMVSLGRMANQNLMEKHK